MTTTSTNYNTSYPTTNTTTNDTKSSSSSKSSSTGTSTATSTASATSALNDNFSSFLKMLTTQMQNQDPLQPMDTNQMTQQLVQFSQVEQQLGTNSRLDKLLQYQQSTASSTNLAYLGRTVSFKGDTFDYTSGMTQAPLAYELDSSAKSVRVDILDDKNRTVRSMSGDTTAGTQHVVSWDFKDNSGNTVQPGTYHINVAPVSNSDSVKIKATTYTFGTVSGVGTASDGSTELTVGSQEVPLSSLTKVY